MTPAPGVSAGPHGHPGAGAGRGAVKVPIMDGHPGTRGTRTLAVLLAVLVLACLACALVRTGTAAHTAPPAGAGGVPVAAASDAPATDTGGAGHGDHACGVAPASASAPGPPLLLAPLPLLWALVRAAHAPAPPVEDAPAAPRHGPGLLTLLCVQRV